ncbi:hypothetical protein B0H21DRAFT_359792 [Amylocystis lapponica]|nr:hypothetical protein B0H21DRAFT_359792 [Amylocystis lapponica]
MSWHFLKRRTAEQDAEMMRLQLLGDPAVMHQLRESNPELAAAAQTNPARFAELLRQTRARHADAERELMRLEADPYDVEAQRRIEEAIRQQAVMENLEHALEYSPEAFGRVTMLYGSQRQAGEGVRGQRRTVDDHEPVVCRGVRDHAPRRPAVRGDSARCRHRSDPRTRTQRAAQARRPAPRLLLHHHGGPRRRPPLRARHAQGAPGVHRPREERAPHPGPRGPVPRRARAPRERAHDGHKRGARAGPAAGRLASGCRPLWRSAAVLGRGAHARRGAGTSGCGPGTRATGAAGADEASGGGDRDADGARGDTRRRDPDAGRGEWESRHGCVVVVLTCLDCQCAP